jgi:hypothetical protein
MFTTIPLKIGSEIDENSQEEINTYIKNCDRTKLFSV